MIYAGIDHHGYGGHLHWHFDSHEALYFVLLSAHHVVGAESVLDGCHLGQHYFWYGFPALVIAHGMLTPSLRSRSVWTRMYPRSHLHLLAGGSILVPLYDVVAAHSQVQVRR
jgi:hypothetical protein